MNRVKKVLSIITIAAIAILLIPVLGLPETTALSKPEKATITSVSTPNATSITVKWKKVKGTKGYQLRYSIKSSMRASKSINLTSRSKTIKQLKPGKKYYVQVRAFKKNGKKKVYGKWSTKKAIHTPYSIKYVLNGGTQAKGQKTFYQKTTATFKLKSPTKKGYTFVGWYTSSEYTKKVTKIIKGTTGNKKFYARWKKKGLERFYNIQIFKDHLAEITLVKTSPNGAILLAKNLLTNRSITISPFAIAFDGQVADLGNWDQNEIGPGKTLEIPMGGTLHSLEHKTVSLNGSIDVIDSEAWSEIDAVNVDIGGTANLEKPVPSSKLVYESDTTKVSFVKLTDNGPVFWVENKLGSSSDIMVATIEINGKKYDYSYVFSYPGKSADYYSIDFSLYKPDIVAATMKTWKVNMGIMNDDEEFPISSENIR